MSDGIPRQARDESIGELLKDLTDETSTLVRQELALARAELTQKGKAAGKGAGMLGAAGVVALLMLGTLTACVVALLSTAVDHVWLAALIVTVVYAAVAAVLALAGRRALKDAVPPAPEETIESVKEDVAWVKTQTRSARA
ncbi:phage holin family protein [Conexibacter sp. CPCC 206217]|uniref:phage holin family protein n=1 Tax=Conexibacter sp. CPCC 206217 TaxID=3064574 RepID=UPI00272702A3|nr:phage holin family protein [Conexibacter sp. CPCC 206217]MDO8212176.1 phage holin family protein [Conexibacter sp. CPCC 206217]